ncbi:MAG: response regulator transcription factor [Oscillochloridaceae bacterium umkhey_bin13]
MTDSIDTQATILVVDDQPELLEGLALTLEVAGYQIYCAEDGYRALAILETNTVDLIIADIAMPELNGYQLYEQVRQRQAWLSIPFLFLSARSLDSDIRYGKAMGVDDYLTKPIKPEDLLASVAGRLRRARELARVRGFNDPASGPTTGSERPQDSDPSLIQHRTLRISPGQHRVWMDEQEVELSPREFKLLELLARQPGQVITLQHLLQASHGFSADTVEAGQLLRPLIRSLRRKLGFPIGEMGWIENVRGVGYRLVVPS